MSVVAVNAFAAISIHALREESDRVMGGGFKINLRISIHALREESDHLHIGKRSFKCLHFNPRSP